jgi:Flp pilus assembly protein TadD
VRAFQDAVARQPEDADPHYMLGTVLKQQGKVDEALAEFRLAITCRPSAEPYLNVGQILQQRGDREGAAAAFAEAERRNKKKADAQAAVFAASAGRSKLAKGDVAGAVASCREAVRLAPEDAQAHYQLALALRKSGARQEARRELAEARRLAPYLEDPADK